MATGGLGAGFPDDSPELLLLQNLAPILHRDTTEATDRTDAVAEDDATFIAEQCTPANAQTDDTRESRRSTRKKRARSGSRPKSKRSKKRKIICSGETQPCNSESQGPVGKVDWEKKLNEMRGVN